MSRGRPDAFRLALVGLAFLAWVLTVAPAGWATEDTTSVDDADQALLAVGAQTYNTVCASCHQAGGVGISGSFPPLAGNPNIEDTVYVTNVIKNGLQGEIVVAGVTYNEVMPAFAALTDEQIEGVIAFMQAGFVVPGGGAPAPAVPSGPVAGTELPGLANLAVAGAFLVVAAAAAVVLGPRFAGRIDRLTMSWLDAWLKTGLIVAFFVLFVAAVPSMVMQNQTVASLDRIVQDIIGTGLWALGLGVGLWALWYAHRDRRI